MKILVRGKGLGGILIIILTIKKIIYDHPSESSPDSPGASPRRIFDPDECRVARKSRPEEQGAERSVRIVRETLKKFPIRSAAFVAGKGVAVNSTRAGSRLEVFGAEKLRTPPDCWARERI
jgi:hypothetical protein